MQYFKKAKLPSNINFLHRSVPRRQQVESKFGIIIGLHKLKLHTFDRKESQCAIKTSKTSGGNAQELENRLQIAIFT